MCSTPFGITGENMNHPDGVRVARYSAQRLSASLVKTYYGGVCVLKKHECAQRLSASLVKTSPRSPARCQFGLCAQRLSASLVKTSFRTPLNRGYSLCAQRLSASLVKTSFTRTIPPLPSWCSTPFGITGENIRPRARGVLAGRSAQRLSASLVKTYPRGLLSRP